MEVKKGSDWKRFKKKMKRKRDISEWIVGIGEFKSIRDK